MLQIDSETKCMILNISRKYQEIINASICLYRQATLSRPSEIDMEELLSCLSRNVSLLTPSFPFEMKSETLIQPQLTTRFEITAGWRRSVDSPVP